MRRLFTAALGVALSCACSGAGQADPTTTTNVTAVPGSTAPTTTAPSTTTAIEACSPNAFSLNVYAIGIADQPSEVSLDATTVVYTAGEPPSGPNALAVGPDGAVWIADTDAVRLATPRLLRIPCEGPPGEVIDLSQLGVASVVDLVVDREGAWLADFNLASDNQRLLKVDATGELLAEHQIPEGYRLSDGFIGLGRAEDGSVLIRRGGESHAHRIIDARGEVVDPPQEVGWMSGGIEIELEGGITVGGTRVPVNLPNDYAGASFLGSTPEGDVLLVLTEIHDGPELIVDETVWRITPDGEVVGKGRVPIAERYLYLEHPLAVAPSGEVMVMLALEDELRVYPMEFTAELEPVLPLPG